MADNVKIAGNKGSLRVADHDLLSGNWYDDKWISPEVEIRVRGLHDISLVTFRIYCPDTSIRLLDNSVTLRIGSQESVHSLPWGGACSIAVPVDVALNGTVNLRVAAQKFLEADKLDNRNRAFVLQEIIFATTAGNATAARVTPMRDSPPRTG